METKNAKITGADIRIERGFILDCYIYVKYKSGAQGFGGYALYLSSGSKNHKINSGYAGHFIYRCMEIADVENWNDLIGKSIRVKATNDKIHEIGHILKEDWFNPSKDFKQ